MVEKFLITDPAAFDLEWENIQTQVLEKLRGLNRFWVSEDLRAVESRTINPLSSTTIPVSLNRNAHLPPIDFDWRTFEGKYINLLSVHARSRLTQSGLVFLGFGSLMPQLEALLESRDITHELSVMNIGPRPVVINKDNGLVAFYTTCGSEMLKGQQLATALASDINIEGEYKDDWYYIDHNMEILEDSEIDKATGILLKLKQEKHIITPGQEPLIPFSSDIDNFFNFRRYLERFLQTMPDYTDQPFWIGETTTPLHISEGYTGLANGFVKSNQQVFFHLESNILEGGRTQYPIRVEMYNPEVDDNLSPQAALLLARNTQSAYRYVAYDHLLSGLDVDIIRPRLSRALPDSRLSSDDILIAVNFFKNRDKN